MPRFFLFAKNKGLNRQWINRILFFRASPLYKAIPVRDCLPRAQSLRLIGARAARAARRGYVHAEVT